MCLASYHILPLFATVVCLSFLVLNFLLGAGQLHAALGWVERVLGKTVAQGPQES